MPEKPPCKVFVEIEGGALPDTVWVIDADGEVLFTGSKDFIDSWVAQEALPSIGEDQDPLTGEAVGSFDEEILSLLEPIRRVKLGTDTEFDLTGLGVLNAVLNGLVPGLMMMIDPEERAVSVEVGEELRASMMQSSITLSGLLRQTADQLDATRTTGTGTPGVERGSG